MTFFAQIELPPDGSAQDSERPDGGVLDILFSRLHEAATGRTFGLAMPDMVTGIAPHFGRRLHIFCDSKDDLNDILDVRPVRFLIRDHCVASPVRPIPERGVEHYARFVRDRRGDYHTPSRSRRDTQRAANGQGPAEPWRAAEIQQPEVPRFSYQSRSTGQSFAIYVRMEKTDRAPLRTTSFGLTRADGAVPILR